MKTLPLVIIIFLSTHLAFAEELQFGLVTLDATASLEVSNDELNVQLQVFEQGKQTDQLTNLVNTKTALVMDALKNFPTITAKTTRYNTRPVYQNGKIDHWQVTQTINLTTSDFEKMSQFVVDINSLAQIQSMQFSVSHLQTEEVKKTLIKDAISQFKNKAKLIATEFGEAGYQVVSVAVDTYHNSPQPVMERAVMMSADASAKGVPATLSAGTNTVSVTVRGTIQINSPTH